MLRYFRPCVTRVPCVKTAKHFVEILSPPDSPIILVFRHRVSLLNSDGFTHNGSAEYKGRGEKIGRFLTNTLVVLGNGAKYSIPQFQGHPTVRRRIFRKHDVMRVSQR